VRRETSKPLLIFIGNIAHLFVHVLSMTSRYFVTISRQCLRFLNFRLLRAVADLVANLDDTLFARVLASDSHVLHNLFPDGNDCSYSRRPRCHARALPVRRDNRKFFDRH